MSGSRYGLNCRSFFCLKTYIFHCIDIRKWKTPKLYIKIVWKRDFFPSERSFNSTHHNNNNDNIATRFLFFSLSLSIFIDCSWYGYNCSFFFCLYVNSDLKMNVSKICEKKEDFESRIHKSYQFAKDFWLRYWMRNEKSSELWRNGTWCTLNGTFVLQSVYLTKFNGCSEIPVNVLRCWIE